MKLLYLAPIDICQAENIGVIKKITSQINAFQNLGANVDFLYLKGGSYYLKKDNRYERLIIRQNNTISKSKPLYDWVKRNANKQSYNFVYIRYANDSISFIKMIKHLKRSDISVYLEYPTFPLTHEKKIYMRYYFKNRDFKLLALASISFIKHVILSFHLKSFIKKIITYSDHINIYGISTIRLNNAIDIINIPVARHDFNQDKYIFIGVANISPGHGYDRIIWGISNYYLAQAKNDMKKKDIIFKIVGEGIEKENLLKLVEDLDLKDKVLFSGAKYGDDLNNEFDNCDIGVGCLAIYRQGLLRSSSLKAREYCARGVPFINNFDTSFSYDLPFVKVVSNSGEPVEIQELLSFCDQCRKNGYYVDQMRKFAIDHLSWKDEMKKIFDDYLQFKMMEN